MKKVLMLGGAYAQIPAIKRAKEMGYYVITCDYCPNNPGHRFADEYYNVSTTDKESVLELAMKLKVDGIVCYASDPAASTAAYVCEKMGFPTNPYDSVKILTNKDLFRDFLRTNGFLVPKSKGYASIEDAKLEISTFKLPVMIKPVDSSGSKGVSKLDDINNLENQVENALKYSRIKRFIIEEYVEGHTMSFDGFSVDGDLKFWCFAEDLFDLNSNNPFVPTGVIMPDILPSYIENKIVKEINRALDLLDMKTGAYNFDIRVDDNGDVYLMEIGPRNGGDFIPQVTHYATGVDLVTYTIKAAMGENCNDLSMVEAKGFWGIALMHSAKKSGILENIEIDEDFRKNNIVEYHQYCEIGDFIHNLYGSSDIFGTMILKFDSIEEATYKMNNLDNYVRFNIKEQSKKNIEA